MQDKTHALLNVLSRINNGLYVLKKINVSSVSVLDTKDGTGHKQHKKLSSPCRAGSDCQGPGYSRTILDIFESM